MDSSFTSEGTKCAAWLYLPEHVEKPPVVIMAHGLGAEKTFRLPAFAEEFVQRELAVFLFDYRNIGESEGEPRFYISPRRHLQDWLSAIAYVRGLDAIDSRKIALWGTSYSGGHVLVAAARTEGISAVVSQVPFVDQLDFIFQKSMKHLVLFLISAIRDTLRRMTFRKPFYIPLIGKPGTFAVLNTPECYDGYSGLIPKGSSWENKITPGGLLGLYRPIHEVHKIKCPVLIVCGEKDSLMSVGAIKRTAKRIVHVTLVTLPINHFEPYTGRAFEEIVGIEGDFLCRTLQ
jgi:pimeloyl-ACP methyl ester carboxylesterase